MTTFTREDCYSPALNAVIYAILYQYIPEPNTMPAPNYETALDNLNRYADRNLRSLHLNDGDIGNIWRTLNRQSPQVGGHVVPAAAQGNVVTVADLIKAVYGL